METIKVVAETPQGYAIINAEDFDAERHTPFEVVSDGSGDTLDSAPLESLGQEVPKRGRKPKARG